MKILATFLALLPLLQAKPIERTLTDLLTAIMQEKSMAQDTNEAVDKETIQYPRPLAEMQSFSLEVTDCDEITKEIQKSVASYLGNFITRKVTLSCSGPKTGDFYIFISTCVCTCIETTRLNISIQLVPE